MPLSHHRLRKAVRDTDNPGGGLTEESLTDTATDGDIMYHETGADPGNVETDVSLDYDEDYDPTGLPFDDPTPDPYTLEEARKDMAGYDEAPFERSTYVRTSAQKWEAKSVSFPALVAGVPVDAYLLAGQDAWRKRILVKNTSRATGDPKACDIAVGVDASVNGYNGYVLAGGTILGTPARVTNGEWISLEHTGDVWIVPVAYAGITAEATTVSYIIERYAQ